MNTSETRGPYAKGVVKRQEILREALAAYDEHDGAGPSLKAIASRVGLSEQGLLHYFGSREALFTAILAERDRVYRDTFADTDPLEKLQAAVRLQAQTPGLSRLYVASAATASDPERPQHDFFVEHFRALSQDVAHMLQVPAESATELADLLGEDRVAFISRILIAAADGLQLRSLVDAEIDLEGDLSRLAAIFGRVLEANSTKQ